MRFTAGCDRVSFYLHLNDFGTLHWDETLWGGKIHPAMSLLPVLASSLPTSALCGSNVATSIIQQNTVAASSALMAVLVQKVSRFLVIGQQYDLKHNLSGHTTRDRCV